ncbi:microtubule-destabilizing protein 60-like [Nicotiana tabacum]|uniref:Microtubule-destabilizing protein 60-like n=2 Tax=Nicotiana TaxID=4085 RepID=A0A1S4CI66_TOBAC|nr:PREDICTED: protein TPX2 [Nicotiana sylvestris]XP_016500704.1 PREDICTED: protein TPX2-like [Nicotiana tabacum]
MESSNTKSAQKLVKSSSQSAIQSPGRSMRCSSPQLQSMKNSNVLRDEPKERSVDKNKAQQKPLAKDNTRPVEIKLHTQQRARRRALFNYSVATKFYFIEQQKKTVEKVQKMIEEEEVRMLRKEMIPRAQLMPFFDKPFSPQRSTRPLTIPREPSFMLNGNCSSCMNFPIFSTMKQVK